MLWNKLKTESCPICYKELEYNKINEQYFCQTPPGSGCKGFTISLERFKKMGYAENKYKKTPYLFQQVVHKTTVKSYELAKGHVTTQYDNQIA